MIKSIGYCGIGICLLTGLSPVWAATSLGTGFTYQGRLNQSGSPVNGTVNLDFSLWDSLAAGTQIGSTQTITSVPVANGLFTVELNAGGQFGASAFNGEGRWLQIGVEGTPLAPRQPVTAAPYAWQAARPWVAQGGNISFSAGNVGIGTSTPAKTLEIRGTTLISTNLGGANCLTPLVVQHCWGFPTVPLAVFQDALGHSQVRIHTPESTGRTELQAWNGQSNTAELWL